MWLPARNHKRSGCEHSRPCSSPREPGASLQPLIFGLLCSCLQASRDGSLELVTMFSPQSLQNCMARHAPMSKLSVKATLLNHAASSVILCNSRLLCTSNSSWLRATDPLHNMRSCSSKKHLPDSSLNLHHFLDPFQCTRRSPTKVKLTEDCTGQIPLCRPAKAGFDAEGVTHTSLQRFVLCGLALGSCDLSDPVWPTRTQGTIMLVQQCLCGLLEPRTFEDLRDSQ